MQIDLANLPAEGKSLQGELPAEIFDLKEQQAKAVSPLHYDLFVQRLDNELLFMGSIHATFELTCSRTLNLFEQTIRIPKAAISLEISDSGALDPTEALREEILIELPTLPRCDEGDDPQPCEIDSRHLAVDKDPETGVENPSADEKPSPWAALDSLKPNEDSASNLS